MAESLRRSAFTAVYKHDHSEESLELTHRYRKTARKHVIWYMHEAAVGNTALAPPPLSSFSTAAFKASRFRMTCDLKTISSPLRRDNLLDTIDTRRATDQHHRSTMCGSDIFLGLVAIIFPPLAVWVKRGICSADSLINIALCSKPYFAQRHLSNTLLTKSKQCSASSQVSSTHGISSQSHPIRPTSKSTMKSKET